ncbi:MAG: RNA-binding S4 domain-containing protein [Verrucomicrobiaceae bacterium]|nr:RNA-binding S4 domain-containing protein [Verrucomicrobiaceae bacterium]
MPELPATTLRADKWLHHVRVFKTRSLATQACARGQVTLGGQSIKASRDLHPGDVLEVQRGDLRLRLRMIAAPASRVGAPLVPRFCENITPEEWLQKAAEIRREKRLINPPEHAQIAKPNKKQLRVLREFWEAENSL